MLVARTVRPVAVTVAVVLLLAFLQAGLAQTLRVAIHSSPWWPAYETVIAAYEEETGVDVEILQYPHGTLYDNQVASAREGTDLYDVMHFDDAWAPFFMGGGYLTPLDEIDPEFSQDPNIITYEWSDRWNHDLNYSTEDGTVYAVPVNGNIQLYFYNSDAFEEAGLSAPTTWDEVEAAAETLHRPAMYGFATITVAPEQAIYFFVPVLRTFGSDIFADPPNDWTITINDEQALAALEWLLEMREYSPPGVGNTGQQDVLSYLANGQLAQAINVSAVYPFMDDPDYGAFPGVIDFAPIPSLPDVDTSSTIGNWVAGIPETSPNKELALDFLRFVTSEEMQVLTGENGGVPVHEGAIEDLASREGDEYRFFRAYNETFPFAESRPRLQEYPQIVDSVATHFQRAMVEEEEPQEALDAMAQEIQAIMEEAGYDAPIGQ